MANYQQYAQLDKKSNNSSIAAGNFSYGQRTEMAPPQLGATFVPGGFDDYYMPEVVAPSPQRYVLLALPLNPISESVSSFYFPDTHPPFTARSFIKRARTGCGCNGEKVGHADDSLLLLYLG
jgi:hypothetical protein